MRAALAGTGYAVPATIRTNDDPIFDWIKKHNPHGTDLFKGYKERRVLAGNETLMDLMIPAAEMALAGVDRTQIDLVLGYASVADYLSPNALAQLHEELGLPARTWVVPLANDFSNYNAGLVFASAMIETGRARAALVAIGADWTRFVDYHTAQSVSASDGAAAAVLSASDDRAHFRVVDSETESQTRYYGTMYMAGYARHELFTKPVFQITDAGAQGFIDFGEKVPAQVALHLLERHGLTGADVTLITHQASSVLMDSWQAAIQPAQYLETLEVYANMTLASIGVNLARGLDQIAKDHVLLLALGPEMHASAVLLKRG